LWVAVGVVVASVKFQEAAGNIGFSAAYMPAAEFGAQIEKDDAFYATLLEQLGLAN
jgi:tripartite-type tricarboxylate transporter receptor subunit TctC